MRGSLPWWVLIATLAACTHGASRNTYERLLLYREHAGPPVAAVQLDHVAGKHEWTPLGDRALAVWPSDDVGYLLEFRTPCPSILTAMRVWITNSRGQVAARADSVMTRSGSGTAAGACRIATIRPVDGRSLGEAKRDLREAEFVDRPAGSANQ